MAQFILENNKLILKVKKPPLIVRVVLFFLAFSFFLIPFSGMVLSLLLGGRFHFGFLIGIVFFGLIGFYMLRNSLWNTFGNEVLLFNKKNQVQYEADYGWFKDGKKITNFNFLKFSIRPVGYEEDFMGALVIEDENNRIETVVKIPNEQLGELIILLEKKLAD